MIKAILIVIFMVLVQDVFSNDDCHPYVRLLINNPVKKEPTDLYLWLSDVHVKLNELDKVEAYNTMTGLVNEREYFIVAPIFFCIRSGMFPSEILQLHGGGNVRIATRILANVIEEMKL